MLTNNLITPVVVKTSRRSMLAIAPIVNKLRDKIHARICAFDLMEHGKNDRKRPICVCKSVIQLHIEIKCDGLSKF